MSYGIYNIYTYNSRNTIAKKIEDEHTESLRFEDGNQRRVEEVALNNWTHGRMLKIKKDT